MNRLPLDIVGTLFEAFIIYLFHGILSGKKSDLTVRPLRVALFFILFVGVNNLLSFYMPIGLGTLFVTVSAILMVYGFLHANLLSSVLVVVASLLMISVVELPLALLMVAVTGMSIDQIIADDRTYLVLFAVGKLFEVFLALLVFRSRLSFERFRLLQREASLIADLIIQLFLMLMIVLLSVFGTVNQENSLMYTIFALTILLALFGLGVMDLRERERTTTIVGKFKVREQQIRNMKQVISVIRREKHDFMNHISTIQGMVSLNRPNALDAIGSYLSRINDSLQVSFRTFQTGNDYLDGLLAIKNNVAVQQNITFLVEVDAPFDRIAIPETDLISIVSNLLDNAFDAFHDMAVEKPYIHLSTRFQENGVELVISDNGRPIPMEISERVFEEGFSTKSELEGERGFGLAITRQFVQRAKGSIYLVSHADETAFHIHMPSVAVVKPA